MTFEENKALVRQYFENPRYNPKLYDQIFALHIHFQTIQHTTLNAVIEG